MPTVAIRSSARRLVVLGVICAAFTLLGVVLLTAGPVGIVVGGLAILFFGVFGAVALARLSRMRDVIVLRPDGILLPPLGLIAWKDFDAAGTGEASGVPVLGVNVGDVSEYLVSSPLRGKLGAAMMWSRDQTGWDLTWPSSLLTGSLEEHAATINEYRDRVRAAA